MRSTAYLTVFALALGASSQAQAADGTLTFEGSIQDSTCVVSGGVSQHVTLNRPAAREFVAEGATVPANTGFSVALSSCTPGSIVSLGFDPTNPTVDLTTNALKNMATSNPAEGIQLELHNEGQRISLNNPNLDSTGASQNATIAREVDASGAAVFPLEAYYVQRGEVKPGAFATSITFDVIYR